MDGTGLYSTQGNMSPSSAGSSAGRLLQGVNTQISTSFGSPHIRSVCLESDDECNEDLTSTLPGEDNPQNGIGANQMRISALMCPLSCHLALVFADRTRLRATRLALVNVRGDSLHCQRKIETSASPQSRKFRFCSRDGGARGARDGV